MTDNDKKYQRILLVDDDSDLLEEVQRTLKAHDINADTLQDSSEVLEQLATNNYSAICLDWIMPGTSGADLLPVIVQQYPHIPVIILTGFSDISNVVNCIKQGAYDYITKPLDASRLVSIVQRAFTVSELADQNRKLTSYLQGAPLATPEFFSDLITCSERMFAIFKIIETFRSSRQPVLITGETGVGKELIARAIHKSSGLSGPMVTVNAAMLDDNMLSDTLFGHKKGAYTGAIENREGLIEQANGGTLFLDEIGDLSNTSQVKLLRLIQQNEYYRLGSDVLRKSNARIITASNSDFEKQLSAGLFRQDLYYRISSHRLRIPPLRERREDILLLARHFATRSAAELVKPLPDFSHNVRQALTRYDFPGNIRELINMMHSAVSHNSSGTLQLVDFENLHLDDRGFGNMLRQTPDKNYVFNGVFTDFPTLAEMEKLLVEEALMITSRHRGDAAQMLGISRPTLRRKMESLKCEEWLDD